MFTQILSCNTDLGTCCNDGGLVVIINIMRRVFHLFQIIVPILLIVSCVIGLFKLVNNPELKNGTKKIFNSFIAAIIVFFIPIFVDAVLGIMPMQFSVVSCWKQAKTLQESNAAINNSYQNPYDTDSISVIVNSDDYEKGNPRNNTSIGDDTTDGGSSLRGGSGRGSATGKAIVEYAKSFVGKPYVYGGSWNGELPYTATDCSGFVQGVFKHFGINLSRTTYSQWDDKSSYTLVNGEILAGDLVMYNGHVAILTGNGNEIVHAKGKNWGIVVDSDYKTSSSKTIQGIMRINGVN